MKEQNKQIQIRILAEICRQFQTEVTIGQCKNMSEIQREQPDGQKMNLKKSSEIARYNVTQENYCRIPSPSVEILLFAWK